MPCDYCGKEFDPISTRWLCPHCHMKANCCDGAPLPERAIERQRLPRSSCSRSIASNSALKLPLPKPSEPCRSMNS